MSKAHHNENYYAYCMRRWPKCVLCKTRSAEQLHHFQVVGSDLYAGPMPRRHSSYNVAGVCAQCHNAVHSEIGEREMVRAYLGGFEGLAREITRRLHEYIDYLEAKLEGTGKA